MTDHQAMADREERRQRDLQNEVRRALRAAGLGVCRTNRGRYGVTVHHFDASTPQDFHAWTRVQPALEAAGFTVRSLTGSVGQGPRLLAFRGA